MKHPDPPGELPTDAASIVTEVLRLNPAQQVLYIDQVCGADRTLRRTVEKALIAHPEAEYWGEGAPLTLSWELSSDAAAETIVQPPETQRIGPGTQLSHYRLEEKIGQGGMGEVYRARDLALGRDVAIKILRDLVDPSLRARLAREANAGARLDHAAVATFIEFARANDIDYLAMEFVDGETLRVRLQRGPLALEEGIALARILLEALVFAHSMGILHRDIKPENIMIMPDGAVKLLDFGVAKDVSLADSEAELLQSQARTMLETMHGAVVGTPGYMAPEQVRGEAAEPASDVFGLGVVLYEALSGRRPFMGENRMSLMLSVLTQDPPPLTNVSAEIQTILSRALARSLDQRYASAREFLTELRQVAEGESVVNLPKSLALFDFENIREEAEHDWIGSGVAESLAVDLGRVEGLEIISRARVKQAIATAQPATAEIDPVALGLLLRARWVLAGTFQHAGNALRVTARLIEVSTAKELWSEKLDGTLDTVLQMQDELAERIADSLDVIVPRAPGGRRTREMDAFECYQRALQLWGRFNRAETEEMVSRLERAIELDPEYAEAYALLARAYAPSRWLQTTDPADLERCIEYASRAIEIEPDMAEAHMAMGYALWRQGDARACIEKQKVAARLDPTCHGDYFVGACLCDLGDFEGALTASQRFQENASAIFNLMVLGFEHMQLGHSAESRWVLREGIHAERDPNSYGWQGAMPTLAEMKRRDGDLEDARADCMEALRWIERSDIVFRTPMRALSLAVLGRVCLDQGDREGARAAYDQSEAVTRSQFRGVGMGHLRAQALAGQVRVTADRRLFDMAVELFEDRAQLNFGWFGLGSDVITTCDLAFAADAVGDQDAGRDYRARSLARGMPVKVLES